MLFLASALATPATLHSPTLRPDASTYVGAGATGHALIVPFSGAGSDTRLGFRATHRVSDRFGLDVLAGLRTLVYTNGGNDFLPEISVRGTLALVDHERFRFGLTAGVGTEFSGGLMLWASNESGRVEFDLHVGYTHHVDWFPGRTWRSPNGILYAYTDVYRSMPELGVRWYFDKKKVHSMRFGFWSANPVLTYRVSPGDHFTASITVGTLLFLNTASADVGWRF